MSSRHPTVYRVYNSRVAKLSVQDETVIRPQASLIYRRRGKLHCFSVSWGSLPQGQAAVCVGFMIRTGFVSINFSDTAEGMFSDNGVRLSTIAR